MKPKVLIQPTTIDHLRGKYFSYVRGFARKSRQLTDAARNMEGPEIPLFSKKASASLCGGLKSQKESDHRPTAVMTWMEKVNIQYKNI